MYPNNSSKFNISQSLDFYSSLLVSYCQLLTNSQEESLQKYMNSKGLHEKQGLELALELFENVGVNEITSVKQAILPFISNSILKNMVAEQAKQFTLKIIEKFLATPIDIRNSDPALIFSHMEIIDILKSINLPLDDLLKYIIDKMGIKTVTSEPSMDVAADATTASESQIFLLSSILIVLNESIKSTTEKPKFSDDALLIIFNIASWVAKNSILSASDKESLLILSIGLVNEVAKATTS